jgi:hypothetical protein
LNSERIHAFEQLFESVQQKKPRELTWDDPLIKGMLGNRYRLRTAAIKNIIKPENLVLVSKLDFADYLEWLLPQVELFNYTLREAFEEFWSAGYERKNVTASVADLRESMFPKIFHLQQAFDIIMAKKKDLLRG